MFFALLFPPVALAMLALVVDVGSLYATKAWLQGVADLAALGAIASLDASQSLGNQDQHVRDVIAWTAVANGLEPNLFVVTSTSDENDLLTVTVRVAYKTRAMFMPALGLGNAVIGIYCKVEISPGVSPLARRAHLIE